MSKIKRFSNRPTLPEITEWLPLREYTRFYPDRTSKQGATRIPVEVQFPDHSVSACKGWRDLARRIIDWTDGRIDERAVGSTKPVAHLGGTRIFGNTLAEHPSGAKFGTVHKADRMNLYFEISLSASDLITGLQGLLAVRGWGEDQIRIRTPI